MNEKELSANVAGYVSLGGEISVHRLGFGAMRLTGKGMWGPPKDRKGALAVLRRAVALGVNFIDTADSYGPGVSEELIAEALFPYPADLVIATKGGWNRPGPDQWTHDASPSHLRSAVEGSLKKLRLDRIDVYQLHIPDPVWSDCPTSHKSISSEHAELYLSFLCRTVIALRIVNGVTWWITVSARKSCLSRGSLWEQAKSRATC
jgi:aryl-alcohol dehydrogenase-like predicted oxidoreductase